MLTRKSNILLVHHFIATAAPEKLVQKLLGRETHSIDFDPGILAEAGLPRDTLYTSSNTV